MAVHRLESVDAALAWLAQRGARALAIDSRRVQPGDAFIAWPGYAVDGRQFASQALQAGAVAVLIEDEGSSAFGFDQEAIASIRHLKAATGELASRFVGEPSRVLDIVACTGTNGKTSMAWWTAQALTALGRRCGVVGTLGVGEPPSADAPGNITATGLTTPDPVTLHAAYRNFVDTGLQACAIEASSIGLAEFRLTGSKIDVALFSNFTQDHLDFHGTMDAYWQAKAQLFSWPGLRAASINIDDEQGRAIADVLAAERELDLWTYSVQVPARLQATRLGYTETGLRFEVAEGSETASVSTGLIGEYNVSNVLAVIGGLRALGITLADAAHACAILTPVPGRMQRVPSTEDDPEVVVDYAHTPDALEKALLALDPFAKERGGRLWCVFGCGGNRDASKRPVMGALAARLAQRVVVTSDNPRLEAPDAIIEQIMAGAANARDVIAIENRATAIATAIRIAGARDVVLIAGKGHEDYQDIGGAKLHFSDVEHALAALQERAGATA